MSDDALRPQDLWQLARVAQGNEWLRSVLCTLARRGTFVRLSEPDRAAAIIDHLSPWPWFKGGQFLFDLLEWEDFMVDGPPPPLLDDVLVEENWRRLEDLLDRIRALAAVGESAPPEGPDLHVRAEAVVDPPWTDEVLPPLETGMHLYRDVVLGVWASAAGRLDVMP